jgi:hypothetical protein
MIGWLCRATTRRGERESSRLLLGTGRTSSPKDAADSGNPWARIGAIGPSDVGLAHRIIDLDKNLEEDNITKQRQGARILDARHAIFLGLFVGAIADGLFGDGVALVIREAPTDEDSGGRFEEEGDCGRFIGLALAVGCTVATEPVS